MIPVGRLVSLGPGPQCALASLRQHFRIWPSRVPRASGWNEPPVLYSVALQDSIQRTTALLHQAPRTKDCARVSSSPADYRPLRLAGLGWG